MLVASATSILLIAGIVDPSIGRPSELLFGSTSCCESASLGFGGHSPSGQIQVIVIFSLLRCGHEAVVVQSGWLAWLPTRDFLLSTVVQAFVEDVVCKIAM